MGADRAIASFGEKDFGASCPDLYRELSCLSGHWRSKTPTDGPDAFVDAVPFLILFGPLASRRWNDRTKSRFAHNGHEVFNLSFLVVVRDSPSLKQKSCHNLPENLINIRTKKISHITLKCNQYWTKCYHGQIRWHLRPMAAVIGEGEMDYLRDDAGDLHEDDLAQWEKQVADADRDSARIPFKSLLSQERQDDVFGADFDDDAAPQPMDLDPSAAAGEGKEEEPQADDGGAGAAEQSSDHEDQQNEPPPPRPPVGSRFRSPSRSPSILVSVSSSSVPPVTEHKHETTEHLPTAGGGDLSSINESADEGAPAAHGDGAAASSQSSAAMSAADEASGAEEHASGAESDSGQHGGGEGGTSPSPERASSSGRTEVFTPAYSPTVSPRSPALDSRAPSIAAINTWPAAVDHHSASCPSSKI